MIIGKAIYAILSGNATVSSAVGQNISAQMAPEATRTGGYPQIVYESHGTENSKTNDGKSGFVQQRIRIFCQALSYDTADALSQAVNSVMMGLPKGTYGGLTVAGAFFAGEDEGTEAIGPVGQDVLVYFKSIDYTIWYYLPGTT